MTCLEDFSKQQAKQPQSPLIPLIKEEEDKEVESQDFSKRFFKSFKETLLFLSRILIKQKQWIPALILCLMILLKRK